MTKYNSVEAAKAAVAEIYHVNSSTFQEASELKIIELRDWFRDHPNASREIKQTVSQRVQTQR